MNSILPQFYQDWSIPNQSLLTLYTGTYTTYAASQDFNVFDSIFIFGSNIDAGDASGYDTLTDCHPVIAFVFVSSILLGGKGKILYSDQVGDDIIGAMMCRQVLECLVDPLGNMVADNSQGNTGIKGIYDASICDACNGTLLQITNQITLGDYLLPAWFQNGQNGPFTKSATKTHVVASTSLLPTSSPLSASTPSDPFVIAPNGFSQVVKDAQSSQSETYWGPPTSRADFFRPQNASMDQASGFMKRTNPPKVKIKSTDSSFCSTHILRNYLDAQIYAYRRTNNKHRYTLRHKGDLESLTLQSSSSQ